MGVAFRWRANNRDSWRAPIPSLSAKPSTEAPSSSSAPSSTMSRNARSTVARVPFQAGQKGAVSGRQRRQGRKPASSAAAAEGKKQTFREKGFLTGQTGRQ